MSIGAQPLGPRDVRVIIDRKMDDFRRAAPHIELRHLDVHRFLDAATEDPNIRLAIETGLITEIRDPVLVFVPNRVVLACPPLAAQVLSEEPAELHRPFVEGAFFRKLFRFMVPATVEGGAPWEAVEQVRDIMQRHFAFQLVAVETVLGQAA